MPPGEGLAQTKNGPGLRLASRRHWYNRRKTAPQAAAEKITAAEALVPTHATGSGPPVPATPREAGGNSPVTLGWSFRLQAVSADNRLKAELRARSLGEQTLLRRGGSGRRGVDRPWGRLWVRRRNAMN